MKLYLLVITLAFASAINYNTLSDFNSAQCTKKTPWDIGHLDWQSPIAIQNSGCLPYGYFNLVMNDASGNFVADNAKGGLTIPYTGATIQSDFWKWTSSEVIFRRKAEHNIYYQNPSDVSSDNAKVDLEIQILMHDSTNNIDGVLSFLVKPYNSSLLAERNAYDTLKIISSATANDISLNFSTAASVIMTKISNPDYPVFLNMFTYNGTLTYPPCSKATWFIYGNILYATQDNIDKIDDAIRAKRGSNGFTTTTFNPDSATSFNYNYRPISSATGFGGGGAQQAARICFTGYFDIYLSWNYGLWFGTVIIVFYFILTLSFGESPITDYDYKEQCKTIHPLVSLYMYGNELHTRKSRASLILAQLTIHCLMDSVFYRISSNKEQPANIIVYAAYSMVISQVFLIIFGSILRKYYVHKSKFLKSKDEKDNQRAQNALFAFYSGLFALIAICWPFCVWNMDQLNPHHSQKSSNFWVASLFVGLALEWLFIDIIWAMLSTKVNFIRNLMRHKGFFYDDLMHQTYMEYVKMD